MNKRSIINKMILLSSIGSCALLFSCKSDKETEDAYGKAIEFEELNGDIIESDIPYDNRVGTSNTAYYYDFILKYTYAIAKTDKESKESHEIKINCGLGKEVYNCIKKYENEVELYDRNQEMKLSVYRLCYPNIECFSVAKETRHLPFYDRELTSYELEYTLKPYGTKLSDIYKKDLIYTENNKLEYYFSESFKYENKEIIDTVSKDDLLPFEAYKELLEDYKKTKEEYGLLNYLFILEPSNEEDEMIKFARISDGSEERSTWDYTNPTWGKGDYAFPLGDEINFVNDNHQKNTSVLKKLISNLTNTIKYVIEDNNVTFYKIKEVAK